MDGKRQRRSVFQTYIFLGLSLLVWEYFLSAILGTFDPNIRRIIWGIIYYSLLSLLIGLAAEITTSLFRLIWPKSRWHGQRYLWYVVFVYCILGFGQNVTDKLSSLGLYVGQLGFVVKLLGGLSIVVVGTGLHFLLGRLNHKYRLPSGNILISVLAAALLYGFMAKEVSIHFFHNQELTSTNILLQGYWLLLAIGISFIIMKIFKSEKRIIKAYLVVPLLLTIATYSITEAFAGQTNYSHTRPIELDTDKPNIIIMLFDALRSDHVGVFATDPELSDLTPTIDSLAQNSYIYPNCYSVSSYTYTAISALFSSTMPNKIGLTQIIPPSFPPGTPTFIDKLNEDGYQTYGLSANYLICEANKFDRPFDDFTYLQGTGLSQLWFPYTFGDVPMFFLQEVAYQMGFLKFGEILADWHEMNVAAKHRIKEAGRQPFFMYLHYIDSHAPYFSDRFSGLLDFNMLKNKLRIMLEPRKHTPEYEKFRENVVAKVTPTFHKRYENCVRSNDKAVADMMTFLKNTGLDENTIVIIMSDHGEEFYEHKFWGHWTELYQESIKIPLIIHVPPTVKTELDPRPMGVSILDVGPTILDLAGIQYKNMGEDGWSLAKPCPKQSRLKYLYLIKPDLHQFGVISEPYKLLIKDNRYTGKIDTVLFDLSADYKEQNNIYSEEKTVTDTLAAAAWRMLNQSRLHPDAGLSYRMTREEKKRLRTLGYVQ